METSFRHTFRPVRGRSPFGPFLEASNSANSRTVLHFAEFVIEFDNSYTLFCMFGVHAVHRDTYAMLEEHNMKFVFARLILTA